MAYLMGISIRRNVVPLSNINAARFYIDKYIVKIERSWCEIVLFAFRPEEICDFLKLKARGRGIENRESPIVNLEL
jgi:hypothetical protein